MDRPEEGAGKPLRDEAGRFPTGVSGNPLGRPKGARSQITELQQRLEIAVRQHLSVERVKAIVDRMCQLAEDGNIKAAKLILDKVIPNAAAPVDGVDAGDNVIVFRIENATFAATRGNTSTTPTVIEAEVANGKE